MTLKQALWEIVRDENIIITNQNIDWLLDRAEKRVNDSTDKNKLKGSILERKEKLDKLGESKLLINQNKSNNFEVKSNTELRIYGARDTSTGKLVSNITNPRRKYWDRKGNAINAINTYNSRAVKYKHGKIELVTFRLVEVQDE